MLRRALFVSILAIHAIPAQVVHPLTHRQIAHVMGSAGAGWLDRSEREDEEHPTRALELIGIQPGMAVGDVGAGSGYMTLRMAKLVGPEGKVYANDIQLDMIERLAANVKREGLENVETVLGTERDAKLPPSSLDLILMVDVYHEFSHPQEMLQSMRRALKPTGTLVLLEYKKEDPSIPINPLHKMSTAEVKTEVEAEGYKFLKVIDSLPRQHIIFFRKVTQ